jgi:hypothetical protein
MISAARECVLKSGHAVGEDRIRVAGVGMFDSIPDRSLGGIVALNVLAYLNPEEERTFYAQAKRTVMPGGFLLVSHSNRLFDLFSLNKYTVNFFADFLISEPSYAARLPGLLAHADHPSGAKGDPLPVRENPLNYAVKLSGYGFDEVRQEFINRHEAPPYPDTLGLPPEERWKLMFTCSTFASLAVRA